MWENLSVTQFLLLRYLLSYVKFCTFVFIPYGCMYLVSIPSQIFLHILTFVYFPILFTKTVVKFKFSLFTKTVVKFNFSELFVVNVFLVRLETRQRTFVFCFKDTLYERLLIFLFVVEVGVLSFSYNSIKIYLEQFYWK